MKDWNASLYLRFSRERTQPAIDLAAALTVEQPTRVLDVGCGPGNSTAVLVGRFPGSEVVGIDSSPAMLEQARADCPAARFELCDVSCQLPEIAPGWDVIFSNACLQWVPDHPRILPQLIGLLRDGGQLAVQIPMNQNEPIHRIIARTASDTRWRDKLEQPRVFHSLAPGEYFDLLSGLGSDVRMWQTTYYHRMPSHEAIIEWYRSTGLRPYLNALSDEDKSAFEADIFAGLTEEYPLQQNGEILFPFPRFFFLVTK